MDTRLTQTLTVAALALALAACAGKPPAPEAEPVAPAAPAVETPADTAPAAEAAPVVSDPLIALDDPRSPLAKRVIYFEFDRSEIRPEFVTVLEAHSRFLVQNPGVKVRLEGHADERGTREYNIGLGDRRAQAVRRLMMFQGVAADQLVAVSYGEERPAADGHDEAAWTQNRRVELVYQR